MRLSLRARLFALTIAVFAIGLVVAGVVVTALVRKSLVGRVDGSFIQIPFRAAAAGLATDEFPVPPTVDDGQASPAALDELRKSVGGIWIRIVRADGSVPYEGPVDRSASAKKYQRPDISPTSAELSDTPSTVRGTGAGERSSYRAIVSRVTDSAGNRATVTIALPLNEVDATMKRIVSVELLVGGLVLALGALTEWIVTRIGLRPLRDMEDVADDIGRAGYPSSRRIAHPPEHTELGRLGARLNTMLDTIDLAFDEKSAADARLRRFVSDASHELRTPLTSIRGYAQLYERAAPNLEVAESSLARIRTESERMSSLVEDLMTLARLDEDPALAPERFDLRELVAAAVHDVSAVDPSRVWTFEDEGPPLNVTADRRRIAQVVLNLLTNARIHTPAGTPVDVAVRQSVTETFVSISDHGPGISLESRAKVFDRFYRTELSRDRSSGGSGLGLAIVTSIVHAHGGSIKVEETPGGGATFVVSLPNPGAIPSPSGAC
jgi:two-component system, OmpR family, sensor kinase